MAIDLVSALVNAPKTPVGIQRLVLQKMADLNNGTDTLFDPTLPAANFVEMLSSVGCASMQFCGNQTRTLFKSAATSYTDLYRFMADKDYIGRFSTPASAEIIFLLDEDSVKSLAVPIPGGGGVRKLTIPKHVTANVANTDFTLEYPIDILVMPHGAITIVYDTSEISPFITLNSNRLKWTTTQMNSGRTSIAIAVDMIQVSLVSNFAHLNALNGFKQTYSYNDAFYYCRAYIQDSTGNNWVEINTTHQDIVYNPTTPTVCLRVLNAGLQVTVPQIYFTNGSIGAELRIDIYTTKGPININLAGYGSDAYKLTYTDVSSVNSSPYSAPLLTMSDFKVTSIQQVVGGSYGKTFDQLKSDVLGRDVTDNDPINELNLPTKGQQGPYEIVVARTNITNRDFLATRQLPPPTPTTPNNSSALAGPVSTQGDTITGVDLTMLTYTTRLSQLAANSQVKLVGDRVIIPSGTLFYDNAGTLDPVPVSLISSLSNPANYSPAALVEYVNSVDMRYTPFQYVIDVGDNQTTCAAYLMNQPVITARNFVQQNSTVNLSMGTTITQVAANSDGSGYLFAIMLDATGFPNDLPAANIGVQLSYKVTDTDTLYFDGVLQDSVDPATGRPVSGQFVYVFNIQTDFDVDRSGLMGSQGVTSVLPLNPTFNLIYYYKAPSIPNTFLPTIMDQILKPEVTDNYHINWQYIAVAMDAITITLGVNLTSLWTRIRTLANSTDYEKYTADVLSYYTADVYQKDTAGNDILVYNTTSKALEGVLLHSKGDPCLDPSTGIQLRSALAGDYMLDKFGNKIPVGGQLGVKVDFDIMVMDGGYYFANDPSTTTYFKNSIALLAQWLQDDIEPLQGLMYARSRLRFYPKRSVGTITILTDNGVEVDVAADQQFTITYTISSENNKNTQLKNSIELATPAIIDKVLQQKVISPGVIGEALRSAFSDTVLSASVAGLFGDISQDAVMIIDGSVRPSVGKILKVTENQTVIMANSVNVVWKSLN